ncbi:inositol monophosphatase family protein [Agrobacterium sp. ES01]|uniref:inositol monophosphatase family protein n=1 Tax=Agrobacterium sp. ES01 TaxID=3420714 RepID=UPI003D0BAC8D
MDTSELLQDVARLINSELEQVKERRFDVEWKADGSPVTAADRYLEQQIAAFLRSKIADLDFIGEETWVPGTTIGSGWRAVLDPIDGTENFCSGLKEWGTSLSLWRGETHAGSLLMMPELYEVMTTGNVPFVPRSRIVGFSSSYHPKIGEGVAALPEARIMGCAVYNLFNVIRGSFSRFINPKGAKSWDLIAGVALAREAGCDVFVNDEEYNGQFLTPDQRHRVDIRHRYDLHSR